MGSKFEIKNNELNVISVDGIRIAIRKESLLHEDFDFVVPAKTLSELLRLLSDDESKIATVSVDRNQGIFSMINIPFSHVCLKAISSIIQR